MIRKFPLQIEQLTVGSNIHIRFKMFKKAKHGQLQTSQMDNDEVRLEKKHINTHERIIIFATNTNTT